jgi:hypothetical protein
MATLARNKCEELIQRTSTRSQTRNPHGSSMMLAPDDDEGHEIADSLDEKIEVAYELGDWMLADHLERVRRQFAGVVLGKT